MMDKLCEPEHLIIIIVVLLLALIATGAGKGIGSLLGPLLRRVFGRGETEVNINLGEGSMAGKQSKTECSACGLLVNPEKCPLHADEHSRSIRNEKGIETLTNDLKATRTQLFGKLETIEGVLTEIKVAVAKLSVESDYQQGRRGKT